jgi:uncharacterized lipoprotein YmbA
VEPSSASSASVAASATDDLTIGLGPITIPSYLDRLEVVTRLSDTEFAISDTDRWGEALDSNVRRVLAQDLSSELPNAEFVPFPWPRKTQVDYKVAVAFSRLEKSASGQVEVEAAWTIRRGLDNGLIHRGTTNADASAGADQRSASAALSRGIAQISQQIAQALQNQPQSRADATAHASVY